MSAATFPTRADQIDANWLTAVLREAGVLGQGRVRGFRLEAVAEPGQTADLARISLDYEGEAAGAPRSLVAKLPASFPAAREVARQYDSYLMEVRFYQVLARSRDLPVPKAYAAEIDPESGDFILLLEDLSGARTGSLFRSSVADVELGLKQLARIHAAFWNDPQLAELPFVRKFDQPDWNAMLKSIASQLLAAARAQLGDQLSPQALGAMDTWLRVWDDLVGYNPDPLTLAHTDAHPKQMFFPTEAVPRFALFDWQQPNHNVGAFDVARLLVTGLSVEDRRAHERALVDGYYAALCSHGVTGFDKDRLWFQIALSHVWNFYINVVAVLQTDVNILTAMAEVEGEDWRACLVGRVGAATEDWKVGDALEAYAAEARAARAR